MNTKCPEHRGSNGKCEFILIPKKQKDSIAHPSDRPRKIAKYDNLTNDAETSGYHMQK